MSILKKKPTDVFVPRSPEIVENVYIPRTKLEVQLKRAIEGTKNVLIKGQSGCGKSWLYKKVFKDNHIQYLVVDLSDAAVEGKSIEMAIKKALNSSKGKNFEEESYSEKKGAEASAVMATANLEVEHTYKKVDSALEQVFKYLAKITKKKSVLVLDNLEHIADSDTLLVELNSILMKVDNADFSKYKVKILVVGTPIGVEKFYRNIKNRDTIGNRIEEIEEVKGLEKKEEIALFMTKTFEKELKIVFEIKNLNKYATHILEVTNGVPQRVHEYCLSLSYAIEDAEGHTEFVIHKQADTDYLRKSLQKYKSIVESKMNSYETSEQRRNQVIFCLGKIKKNIFSTAEMERVVREQFNIDKATNIQISNTLSKLAEGENPLLSKSDLRWIVQDSLYIITIKLLLEKKKGKVVERNIQ